MHDTREIQRQLTHLRREVDHLRQQQVHIPVRWPSGSGQTSERFLAQITGNEAIVANAKWKYSWVEVVIDGDGASGVDGGRSGTFDNDADTYALNLVEINNTTADAIGGDGVLPDTDGAYPAGFKRRPIGGGGTTDDHTIGVVVEMTASLDAAGVTRYTFSQVNAHDGTCEAEE